MGVFLFSMKMLKKEYKKTFMYALTLMFAIAACFVFFAILNNDLITKQEMVQGGGSWSDVVVPVSTGLAFLIIIFCSAMIIFANTFYLTKKTTEFAITTMSGANILDMVLYLTYQNLAITILVMPFGLGLGYLFSVLCNAIMYYYLYINASIFMCSLEAFLNTFATVCSMIFALIIYSSGYVYRHDIQDMLSTQTVNEHEDKRIFKFPKEFYIGLYLFGIVLMIFSKYKVSVFIFPSLLGILGAGGIMTHVLPGIFSYIKKKKYIADQIMLISLSNLAYSLKKSIFLVSLYCISSTVMIALLVSVQHSIREFISVVVGLVITVVLLSLGILYKYSSEAVNRKIFYFNLYKLGYTVKKLKKIIKKEVVLYYGFLLLIPMIYIIIILTRCYIHSDVTLEFSLILLVVEILPPCIIGLLTYNNYKSVVLKIIKEGMHYE